MSIRKYLTPVIFTILAVTGCQTSGDGESYEDRSNREQAEGLQKMGLTIGEEIERIDKDVGRQGFSGLSDFSLVAIEGINDYYLITLRTPCFNLKDANAIELEASDDFYIDRFASVILRTFGQPVQRCPVGKLYKLNRVTP